MYNEPHREEFRPRNAKEIAKKPEFYAEKLAGMMRQMSERVNKNMKEHHGLDNFLTPDGALNMDGYAGDAYTAEQVRENKNSVHELEIEYSNANNQRIRDFHGVKTADEMVERWKKEKLKSKSTQLEMAVTGLLYKFLKDKFLVVRSAPHDDYKNGVDNLILDENGNVIGAFDEGHEGITGNLVDEKIEKITKIAKKGGAQVRYGLKLEERSGKIKRSEMKNVPVFYLGLNNNDLLGLLNNTDYNPDSSATPKEKEIFDKLIASLKQQLPILKNAGFSEEKLDAFITSLAKRERTGTA